MDFMLNEREYRDLKMIIKAEKRLALSRTMDLLFYGRKIKRLKDSYETSLEEGRYIPGELAEVMSQNINDMNGILDQIIHCLKQNENVLFTFLENLQIDSLGQRCYVVCWDDEDQDTDECLLYSYEEAEKIIQQIGMDTHFTNKNMHSRMIGPEEAETIIRNTFNELTGGT